MSHLAAAHHRDLEQVGTSGLLVRQEWLPAAPVPLDQVALQLAEAPPGPEIDGTEPETAALRPPAGASHRFATYADALKELAPPRLLEDRPCYRLLDVDTGDGHAHLTLSLGTYFDVVNVCEAAAHEFAVADRAGGSAPRPAFPFRSLVGDPLDLRRRSVIPAISALTIRRSASDGARMVLHKRDSAQVAHGGGLHQVMPVGIFQPSDAGDWNVHNDFDLWRSLVREYSEEFLGTPECRGAEGPIDYDRWAFYRDLTDARDGGQVRAYWLGLGVDPLSFATDLLVVVVFDEDVFDASFGEIVTANDEGRVVTDPAGHGAAVGLPFTPPVIERFTRDEPMQAAGAALLELAWRHRTRLGIFSEAGRGVDVR